MKALLDTNVLLAALVTDHPHYRAAEPWLTRAQDGEFEWVLSSHNLAAQLYSALTGRPLLLRMAPAAARELIRRSVQPFATVVSLTPADYLATLDMMDALALSGAIIYDALIARAAEKAGVDKLVTFNVAHFRRVWPEGAGRIVSP